MYSQLFQTIHDESKPIGRLGRGTHYSILRAIVWERKVPQFHDFAVIWDEDHDARVIWIAEQLFVKGMLQDVHFIGERKGGISIITKAAMDQAWVAQVEQICENMPSDSFCSEVTTFGESSNIINARSNAVEAYIGAIDALWHLGAKPLVFNTRPFGAIHEDGGDLDNLLARL